MSYTGDYVLSVRTPSDDLLLPLRWLQRKEAEEGGEAVAELYRTGYAAYQAREYETALEALEKCYNLDNTQGDALYFLARSCHGAEIGRAHV